MLSGFEPYPRWVLLVLRVFYGNGFLSYKTRGLHRRDVTHILSKVSCFYWNPFIFVGYRNGRLFPHTNPYISNVTQQRRSSPMFIFRAWATSAWVIWPLYHFVMTSTAFHFPWLTSRTLYIKKKTPFTRPGHPTTISCKISVRRSKNCLEFSIPWGRLKISR